MMETTSTPTLTDGIDALALLVQAGMTQQDVEKMRKSKDNAMAGKMLGTARSGYESIDERFARRIMGDNIFGRDEWSDSSTYGVSFNSRQSRIAANFPYSDAMLDSECLPYYPGKAIREVSFAFLGMDKLNGQPLTIMQWQQIHPDSGQPRFYNYGSNCWYPSEEFATKPTLEFRWYLGLKEVVPNSTSTSWQDMQGMIPAEYYAPSPVLELTKDFLVYQKTKVYPNKNVYAATDKLHSGGIRVIVGRCYYDSVDVLNWSGNAIDYVGLSLFRKSA